MVVLHASIAAWAFRQKFICKVLRGLSGASIRIYLRYFLWKAIAVINIKIF